MRGVSCESIREWGQRFGRIFANILKRRWPQPGDKWDVLTANLSA
jgi:hypothetical protein